MVCFKVSLDSIAFVLLRTCCRLYCCRRTFGEKTKASKETKKTTCVLEFVVVVYTHRLDMFDNNKEEEEEEK